MPAIQPLILEPAERPDASRVLAPAGGGTDWALLSSGSLLDTNWLPPSHPSRRVVVDATVNVGESGAERSLLNWGPRGKSSLDDALSRVTPRLQSSHTTLLLRAGADGVLSDVPSCLSFARTYSHGPFGLILDISAMLSESMLARTEEHLDRFREALVAHTIVKAVRIGNLARDGEHLSVIPCGLGEGLIPLDLLRKLASSVIKSGVPLVLPAPDHSRIQRTALGLC